MLEDNSLDKSFKEIKKEMEKINSVVLYGLQKVKRRTKCKKKR